jgi:hypothetical protein
MPRLSLWKDGQHSNDYKFMDRRISEMFTIGGTGILVNKYLGPVQQTGSTDPTQPDYLNQSAQNIQDLLWLENRDRKYEHDVYKMRGIYQRADQDFDLSQFGLFLQTGTIFMVFHLRDMVDTIGRKLMSGDVLELQHLKDYDALNEDLPAALKRYYVVSDASFAAEGFTPTWWPHLWRVKLNPLVDSQEYKDILDNIAASNTTTTPVGQILSTYDKYMAINEAIVAEAEIQVPLSGYDTAPFYTLPTNPAQTDPRADNVTPLDKIEGYMTGSGAAPNSIATGAGIAFPNSPTTGEYFLRLDYLPNRLFRYNGTRWVKVEDGVRTNLTPGAADNLTQKMGYVNNSNTYRDSSAIPAGSFVAGNKYSIRKVGNTDFTTIGSSSNIIGTVFVANSAGTGTGVASNVHNELQPLSRILTPRADNNES